MSCIHCPFVDPWLELAAPLVSLYDTAISADVVGDQGGCQYVPTCAEREREMCQRQHKARASTAQFGRLPLPHPAPTRVKPEIWPQVPTRYEMSCQRPALRKKKHCAKVLGGIGCVGCVGCAMVFLHHLLLLCYRPGGATRDPTAVQHGEVPGERSWGPSVPH